MKTIEIDTLRQMELTVRDIEVFAESWSKRKQFSLYEKTPRPCSALFFICTDVRVSFYTQEQKEMTAGKGNVVWIPAGIQYRVEVSGGRGNQIDTYTVNFILLDEANLPISVFDTVTVLSGTDNHRLEVRAAGLCDTVHRVDGSATDGRRNLLKIKSEFFALLDALIVSTMERTDAYYPIRIGADALRDEWNQNEKIEKYAALCGISNAYFYRCFQRWAGKSPVEYRNLIRLSNAEAMLRYTDMKIGEISELIGFDDAFYFCRIFANRYGMSPREYRKAFASHKN